MNNLILILLAYAIIRQLDKFITYNLDRRDMFRKGYEQGALQARAAGAQFMNNRYNSNGDLLSTYTVTVTSKYAWDNEVSKD